MPRDPLTHKPGGDKATIEEKQHMFDKPQNIKRVLYGLYTVCGLSVLADFIINRHHAHDHPWEVAPLFYCIYGFTACVVLVLAATQMRKVLMRGEDYYDE